MSSSFWKLNNGFTSLSNISTILENYAVSSEEKTAATSANTLVKLLDESDLLQELMSNNTPLLEFLRDDSVIDLLADLLILESLSGDELDESLRRLNLNDDVKREALKKDGARSKENSAKEAEAEAEIEANSASDNEMPDSNLNASTAEKDDDEDRENEGEPCKEQEEEEEEEGEEEEDEPKETFEERRTRYATLAAEILSADVWSLTDTVMESTQNLNKLWLILDFEPPLSINLATYFMKIMEHLLDMKCEEMVTYLIENQPQLVLKFTRHLANPPLMDFLLKLISTDKPDNSTGIIDFLQLQGLIPQLVDALHSAENPTAAELDAQLARQSSAADFLKALITISANSTTDNSTIGPNELTRELVSHEIMAKLCDIMLQGGYSLGNGVGIIIEIIRKNNSDYDILPVLYITLESHPPTGRDPIYLGHLLRVFGGRIGDFNTLLMHTHENSTLKTTFGEIEPLGFERFKICELVAELLHCSNMALLNDNKGFDVVRVRDELRCKLKEIDPVGFKYNEAIDISAENLKPSLDAEQEVMKKFEHETKRRVRSEEADYNDTIDSFNANLHENSSNFEDEEDEEVHANANLTEEQMREQPVVGDFLKIALYDTQIISNILSMFFNFPWNNFLHNVVFDIVQQVLNGSMDIGFNKLLAIDIFHSGKITVRITEGQKLCNDYEESNGGLRLGYMGHLTLIAEEVVKFIQLYPINTVSQFIDEKIEDEIWEDYVSHVLFDTRKKYNAILGGSDVDDDEGSHTFDESAGELIDDGDLDSGLHLDSTIDHDLIGSGYDNHDKEEEFTEDIDVVDRGEQQNKKSIKFTSSDESESEEDDDDHFASYMSLQLANSGSSGFMTSLKNKAKEFSENEGDTELDRNDYMSLKDDDGDDDDDYIDPNDDGLSYKKPHSLYDSRGMLVTDKLQGYHHDKALLSDDSSSSSSDSDEDRVIADELSANKLTRAASKGS